MKTKEMKLNKWQNYETLAKIIVRGEKDILQSKKKKKKWKKNTQGKGKYYVTV